MSEENEMNQAGFDAIAEAMHHLYPDQQGLYYGTLRECKINRVS